MKRIITAAVLAVFAAVVCFFGRGVTERHTERISETMTALDAALSQGDAAQALEFSERMQEDWEKMHGQLCIFLQHEDLDPLENIFALLPHYIEQGEFALARAQCRLVRTTADHILKTERLTLENLL